MSRRKPISSSLEARLPSAAGPDWLARMGVRSWLGLGIFAAAAVVLVMLSAVSAIVMPLLLAAVLGILFRPLVDAGERRGLPRAAGSALLLVAILAVAVGLVALVAHSLLAQAPEIARLARRALETSAGWFAERGRHEQVTDEAATTVRRGLPILGGGLWNAIAGLTWSVVGFFIGAFFALFTLFFTLRDGHKWNLWLDERLGLLDIRGAAIVKDAEASVRRYFVGTGITAVLTVPIVLITMALLGLPLLVPVLIVYLVTSFVPYVGAWIGGAFAIVIALGGGGLDAAIIVLIAVVVSNGTVQSTVASWAVGKRLSIHPVIVLAVTAIAGLVGGITLMILAAPVTATVLITARRVREVRDAAAADCGESPAHVGRDGPVRPDGSVGVPESL
jgi:predicted PurR-regulated permease PerM